MKNDGTIEKSDFKGSDRLREDLIGEVQQPGGLFFCARYLLGFNRLSKRVHLPPSLWLEENIKKPNSLMAMRDDRGSGKTTMCNIGLSPWAFLQPKDESGDLGPIRGLDTRIADVAPKKDLVSYGHLLTIRNLYDQAEVYKELTHDIIVPRKDMWSLKNGLSFMRPSKEGGPNIVPLGLTSITTGMHPTIFMCDDLVHEHNFHNRNEIERIKQWMIHSHNLTESEHGARLFIGNIWALDDPQDFLRPETEVDGKRIFERVQIWERGLRACTVCLSGRPLVPRDDPNLHSDHRDSEDIIPVMLDNKEDEPATIDDVHRIEDSLDTPTLMAQYYNRPVAPGTLQLDLRDIKHWQYHPVPSGGEPTISIGANPRYTKDRIIAGEQNFVKASGRDFDHELIPISSLDVYILVDPAPSKEESSRHSQFAITVEGCERIGLRQFHLDEYAKNAPPRENIDAILNFFIKWYPMVNKIGIESVAYQATIGDALLDRAHDRHIHTIREGHVEMMPRLSTEGAQEDRIRYVLTPLFGGGNYYVHDTHRIIKAQVSTFGVAGAKHDLLDALSNINRIRKRRAGRPGQAMAAAQVARDKLRKAGTGGY